MLRQSPTDEDLVHAIRGGDLDAFDVLYARWERRLFGYIRRQVDTREQAEDLFQEVFLTVLRDRSYAPHRGRFAPWLFTAARNRCIDHRRADQREFAGRRALVPAPPPETTDALPDALQARTVRAAVASLPTGQQNLLLLKQVGDLTYREIADLEGIPEGTVKSRLHQATRAFRRALARLTPTGERP